MKAMRRSFLLLMFAAVLPVQALLAEVGVYLEPQQFIEQSFSGEAEQKVLWLDRETRTAIADILGHPYKGLRIRYWELDGRTAWILEEIGKTEMITAGFIVEKGELQQVKILIYRETHGWEVRYPFFTDQFKGTGLNSKGALDRRIDGISGATLSVNAIVRLSEMTLYLDARSRL